MESASFRDEVLDAHETAAALRVSINTTYTLLAEGKLPGVRVGRQWRVSRRAIELYLNGDAS
ncbi:unannotated protein [freshwater metagenome]|uniref:Unannotated protein n=1 Tax=freshwater metagenome TaxID=449393 RepID=A0A6J7HSP4_9ZZZZ|nr:helix-turn-helix domain-containing protein [Actinomycetota bacterium]